MPRRRHDHASARPRLCRDSAALRKADAAGHGGFAGHRPVSIQEEQAAMQGDADRGGYLPARVYQDKAGSEVTRGAAKAIVEAGGEVVAGPIMHVMAGNAGTIQAPTPLHAAEPAKIGTETR